jgi:hypothetical protein
MNTEAVEWLEARFDQSMEDWLQTPPDECPGFSWVRPMLEFLPVIDDGWTAMEVTSADYLDPGRWWL